MATNFTDVYNAFLAQITDDLYMELTPEDTIKDLRNLLINGLPEFEFPRQNLYDYTISQEVIPEGEVTKDDFIIGVIWNELEPGQDPDETTPTVASVIVERSTFAADLTKEEIYILALIMKWGWLQRQITSIENVRMKYSGSDFKFSSQANHLSKLLTLSDEVRRQHFHLQRLYKRRKIGDDSIYASNWGVFREVSALDDD